jgi:hypothetical protein
MAPVPLPVAEVTVTCPTARALAVLPFDTARVVHARAARAGLVSRSLLASRDFEHGLGALERMLLGPWARRV